MPYDGTFPGFLRTQLDEISERNEMWRNCEPVAPSMHLAEIINRGFDFLCEQPVEPDPMFVLTWSQHTKHCNAVRAGWNAWDCLVLALLPASIYG